MRAEAGRAGISTVGAWSEGCRYSKLGYEKIGRTLARLLGLHFASAYASPSPMGSTL